MQLPKALTSMSFNSFSRRSKDSCCKRRISDVTYSQTQGRLELLNTTASYWVQSNVFQSNKPNNIQHTSGSWLKEMWVQGQPNIFLVGPSQITQSVQKCLGAEGIRPSLPANPVPGLTKHETTARLPFLIKWPYTDSSGKNWCKQIIKLLIARVRTKMVTMKDYPLYRIVWLVIMIDSKFSQLNACKAQLSFQK